MAVGIRQAGHVAPLFSKVCTNFVDKRRSSVGIVSSRTEAFFSFKGDKCLRKLCTKIRIYQGMEHTNQPLNLQVGQTQLGSF
jgi:hypothetical protein